MDRTGERHANGSRVRIVDGTPAMQAHLGKVGTATFSMGATVTLFEGEDGTRMCVNPKEIQIAPEGQPLPEIIVHAPAAGEADVHLVEHDITGAYSMWRVGNWEGTATYWHAEQSWNLSEGGETVEHPAPSSERPTAADAWREWSAAFRSKA
jgi:hypothetical protein